jgi:hypothetical protein
MKSVDRPATGGTRLATDREMCRAIPAVALHGWREDVRCASTACTSIVWQGDRIPVCEIHEAKWQRAFEKHGMDGIAALAKTWRIA